MTHNRSERIRNRTTADDKNRCVVYFGVCGASFIFTTLIIKRQVDDDDDTETGFTRRRDRSRERGKLYDYKT